MDWVLVGNVANLVALVGGLTGVVLIITRALTTMRLELETKIDRSGTELRTEIAQSRSESKADTAELRAALTGDIAKLDDRVYALAARIAPTLDEPKARSKTPPRTA